jgi:predicted transcriptional regulator
MDAKDIDEMVYDTMLENGAATVYMISLKTRFDFEQIRESLLRLVKVGKLIQVDKGFP